MTLVAVIDDDDDFVDLVAQILQFRDIDCLTFTRSACILEELRARKPDVIVLDVRMERRDSGWSLVEQLEADRTMRNIPLVVCSAASDELRSRRAWLEARNILALEKPFDINDFYIVIDRQLGRATCPSEADVAQ